MVSNFRIQTSIFIENNETIRAFYEAAGRLCVADCEELVPEYFDRIRGDPQAVLESYNESNLPMAALQFTCLQNPWAISEEGRLYVRSEHANAGAISMLHYWSKTVFEPRGTPLYGYVVGVNRIYPMIYVYEIEGGRLSLDRQLSRRWMEEYETMLETEEDPSQAMLDRIFAGL